MLDPWIYRAGLVPVLLAVVVAAFSIQTPPRPLTATLPPDSFSGARAYVELQQLVRAFPNRAPGGSGDRALASRVERELMQREDESQRPGFRVRTRVFEDRTVRGSRELRTVIGERTGLSRRQIVVVAHRDALSSPSTAELSGTAGLIELVRVFRGRTLRKTLVLVSTTGGSAGAAGAAEVASRLRGPVDGVIVLGDLAGNRLRRPFVVPWSDRDEVAPPVLHDTLAGAVRQESGGRPGSPGLVAQFAHLAFPLTPGEQGRLAGYGLPAVLVSVSGDRGPEGARAVNPARFGAFGRAVLRGITALDASFAPPRRPRAQLRVLGKLLPGWAVRLLVAALMLPALLAAVDGFARVRRRRHPVGMWIAWVLAAAIPLAAALAFGYMLALVGLIPRLPAPPPPGAAPPGLGGIAVLAVLGVVGVAAWRVSRPLVLRAPWVQGDPASPGAAAALALVLAALATAAWVFNPFAATLLLPALHGWILLTAPEVRIRRGAALAAVALTLVPVALVVLYYGLSLGAGPLQLVWGTLLLVVGGHVGVLGAVSWCVLFACLVSVVAIVRAKPFELPERAQPTLREPVTYARRGLPGGAESALRR
jgi:hypothetical protein